MNLLEISEVCERVKLIDAAASLITLQVLILLENPITITEIGAELNISYNTIKRIVIRWSKFMTTESLVTIDPIEYRHGRPMELSKKGKKYLFGPLL